MVMVIVLQQGSKNIGQSLSCGKRVASNETCWCRSQSVVKTVVLVLA